MTLLELVTHLRTNILYDTGGTGVDWTLYSDTDADSVQLRWTNEELVANINEAINQVYRRISPIKDTYSLPVKTNVINYTLPSYIKQIESGRRSDGKSLTELELDDFTHIIDFDTRTGDIENYVLNASTGKLRIYPTPVADETAIFYVYRLPKTKLTWETIDEVPELSEDYQVPMLFGAASLCYMKDEANTFDPQRSNYLSGLFDREFPFTSVYSTVRKSRSAKRPIRYGGI